MRIRLFPNDLEGSGCYRMLYPYGHLDVGGDAEIVMEGEMRDGKFLLPIPPAAVGYQDPSPEDEVSIARFMDSDIYVFQSPLKQIYPGVLAKLQMRNKKVVVELDDYMHGMASTATKNLGKSSHNSIEALEHCVRMADLVTVATAELRTQYRKLNPNIVVLPNYLRRHDFNHIEPSYKKDREQIRVGWMGLMDYRVNDLSLIKPWIRRFLKAHPEVVFVNVGSKDALDYLCIPKDRRLHFERATFPRHFEPTSEIDIGLVPLTKNAFNESKSHLKGMEYGAVGATVIASPTREYRTWVEDGTNGLLVESGDWEDCLEFALQDDNWETLAHQNHLKALENLIEDHYKEWVDPLCSLLSSPSLSIA